MKKTRNFVTLSIFSLVLTGCSSDTFDKLFGLFKKAAKQTADMIVVSEEKKASLISSTKNYYAVDFELESQKPYTESETQVLDISSLEKESYAEAFKSASQVYEQKNGKSNITQSTYFSKDDSFLKYQKDEDDYEVHKNDGSYEVTKNGEEVDLSVVDKQEEFDNAFTLASSQLDYCFSYELNSLINIKARLLGSTADEHSTMNFLTNVVFKEYKDSGNYVATYVGEAHKKDGSKDIKIDYIELKYVDYRIQYSLTHSVETEYNSLIETHKLSYSKLLYNVSLEDCFK